jgi:hypothetical protein
MNDRNKHKQVTGQMNHQIADPKAKASVFLFFPRLLPKQYHQSLNLLSPLLFPGCFVLQWHSEEQRRLML